MTLVMFMCEDEAMVSDETKKVSLLPVIRETGGGQLRHFRV